jgi:hypothetical protein
MKKSLAASAFLVALLGAAAPAHAGFVTYASGNGADGVGCGVTPTSACREIFGATGALAQTDEGGIIHVIPGEYIAFPVEKGVDIVADAGQASIYSTVAGGGGGIVVDVSGEKVVRIRGFLINSAHGIVINGSGVVHIEDSTLMGVEDRYGIVYAPTGAGELYVSGTRLTRPTVPAQGGGALIRPTGSGSAKVVLDNISVEDNAAGILIDGSATTGNNDVTVRNSTIVGSATFGLKAIESGVGQTNVMIEGSSSANNAGAGILATGSNVTVRMRNSTVTRNERGLFFGGGANVVSHGGNVIVGNYVADGAFSSTVPQN